MWNYIYIFFYFPLLNYNYKHKNIRQIYNCFKAYQKKNPILSTRKMHYVVWVCFGEGGNCHSMTSQRTSVPMLNFLTWKFWTVIGILLTNLRERLIVLIWLRLSLDHARYYIKVCYVQMGVLHYSIIQFKQGNKRKHIV